MLICFTSVLLFEFNLLRKRRGELLAMDGDDVEDFLKQNRDSADLVEKFQSISESEKQWKFRREFILRNLSEFQDTNIDHLLSLSMVWANHVFLGCRYSQDLMEKVKEMAEDIEVEDAPVFKTRDEIMKQRS